MTAEIDRLTDAQDKNKHKLDTVENLLKKYHNLYLNLIATVSNLKVWELVDVGKSSQFIK